MLQVNLRELLGKHRMTIKDLSEKTHLSEQQLCLIKHGKTKKISFSVLEKLLQTFGCEPNDLFTFFKN